MHYHFADVSKVIVFFDALRFFHKKKTTHSSKIEQKHVSLQSTL